MKKIGEHTYMLSADDTASGQAQAWDVGRGELFTSTAAHALKATLEYMMAEDERIGTLTVTPTHNALLSSVPAHPKWLMVANGTTQGFVYQNGTWILQPGHDERAAPPAVAKVCTCGVKFTGGEHSDWCDSRG
jgi:hypothetical protein